MLDHMAEYTTVKAAQYLGVSVGRIYQLIGDGTIKTSRFGKVHVITKEALDAAKARKTKPGPVVKSESTKRGKKR
jgi:excisionase family DNA binding protein